MIPKIIHYCWFGDKPKPKKVQKCIESWNKILPEYQIIEWNEQNFDYKKYSFTEKAYKEKKYAFVSDVARIEALLQYGGIYLDTDVEVFKSFDDILNEHCVLGFEERNYIATSFIACEKECTLMREFHDIYLNTTFDGTFITNVVLLTNILKEKGLKMNNQLQVLESYIRIFPKEFFSPYDYINCINLKTDKTYCVHYFYVSWLSKVQKMKKLIKSIIVRIIGKKYMDRLRGYDDE